MPTAINNGIPLEHLHQKVAILVLIQGDADTAPGRAATGSGSQSLRADQGDADWDALCTRFITASARSQSLRADQGDADAHGVDGALTGADQGRNPSVLIRAMPTAAAPGPVGDH